MLIFMHLTKTNGSSSSTFRPLCNHRSLLESNIIMADTITDGVMLTYKSETNYS